MTKFEIQNVLIYYELYNLKNIFQIQKYNTEYILF